MYRVVGDKGCDAMPARPIERVMPRWIKRRRRMRAPDSSRANARSTRKANLELLGRFLMGSTLQIAQDHRSSGTSREVAEASSSTRPAKITAFDFQGVAWSRGWYFFRQPGRPFPARARRPTCQLPSKANEISRRSRRVVSAALKANRYATSAQPTPHGSCLRESRQPARQDQKGRLQYVFNVVVIA